MSIAKPTDEELRDICAPFLGKKTADARMPSIPEIRFSNAEVSELLKLLGRDTADINHQELLNAGRWFPDALYLQELQSNSELEKAFAGIQNAALSLLEKLGVKGGSTTRIPHSVSAYLQIAACEYGIRVGRPRTREQMPWNFWEAYKLPSVIVGVSLLEHWAGMARDRLRAGILRHAAEKQRRNPGATAMRVLIHKLAFVWRHTTGEWPGAGFSSSRGTADGPFIRFALRYLEFMRKNITAEHRQHVPCIDAELTVARRARQAQSANYARHENERIRDSIRVHLKSFKRRLASSKSSQMARSPRRKH